MGSNIFNEGSQIIEQCPQLSKSNLEQNGEFVKPPDMLLKNNSDIRHTEVHALNMEVETLRWQLAQTEANRQMHIALLQQIVTFLNRVKEHIENQKTEGEVQLNTVPPAFPKFLNKTDLPRSGSAFHVSKNNDYALSPTKKISTRKFSKSISNVNGYKDCSNFWSQSKLSLVSENEVGHKLTEEMSRLIILANTVLSTKLPDLACSCVGARIESTLSCTRSARKDQTSVRISKSLDSIEENVTDTIVMNTNCSNQAYNGITNELEDVKTRILNDFIVSQPPPNSGIENEFSGIKLFDQEHPSLDNGFTTSCGKVVQKFNKTTEYNVSSNFIEDESGFSSMSSFQEIGIPIISIIPPSPCKEVEYLEDICDATEKWKADAIELDKQSVKVFWV